MVGLPFLHSLVQGDYNLQVLMQSRSIFDLEMKHTVQNWSIIQTEIMWSTKPPASKSTTTRGSQSNKQKNRPYKCACCSLRLSCTFDRFCPVASRIAGIFFWCWAFYAFCPHNAKRSSISSDRPCASAISWVVLRREPNLRKGRSGDLLAVPSILRKDEKMPQDDPLMIHAHDPVILNRSKS